MTSETQGRDLNAAGSPNQTDERASAVIDLRDLWRDLRAGVLRIEDAHDTSEHHFLTLKRRPVPEPLTRRSGDILEHVFVKGRKATAVEFGAADSTVAVVVTQSLRHLGVQTTSSRAPALLVLAINAKVSAEPLLAELLEEPDAIRVRLGRPDKKLRSILPASEYEVARLLIEGHGYQDIARARQTSVHTVANQIAALSHRLGVPGRLGLLRLLVPGQRSPEPLEGRPARAHGSSTNAQAVTDDRVRILERELASLRERIRVLEAALSRERDSASTGAPS